MNEEINLDDLSLCTNYHARIMIDFILSPYASTYGILYSKIKNRWNIFSYVSKSRPPFDTEDATVGPNLRYIYIIFN